ncbi:MAG TPA: hypothetical protein VFS20_01735 [Longimicrobium sp.]|nr:hypothetical protein [Longimicrobium sp.]
MHKDRVDVPVSDAQTAAPVASAPGEVRVAAAEGGRPGCLGFGILAAMLLLFYGLGVMGVAMGVIGLITGRWPVGPSVGALITGGAGLFMAISFTIGARRAKRRGWVRETVPAGSSATARRPRRVPVPADQLLAEWTLAADEWRAFNECEALEMRRGLLYNTLVGVVLGGVPIKVFGGAWVYAVMAGLLAGAMNLAISLALIARTRRRVPEKGGGVVIRGNSVDVDGVVTELVTSGWHLSSAKLRNDLPLPVIEICTRKTRYERNGSRRTYEDVLRVPVPRGREEEAAQITQLLRRGVEVDEDDD